MLRMRLDHDWAHVTGGSRHVAILRGARLNKISSENRKYVPRKNDVKNWVHLNTSLKVMQETCMLQFVSQCCRALNRCSMKSLWSYYEHGPFESRMFAKMHFNAAMGTGRIILCSNQVQNKEAAAFLWQLFLIWAILNSCPQILTWKLFLTWWGYPGIIGGIWW